MATLSREVLGELPTLVTGGLVLRHITASDAPALFEIFSDPEVTLYWSSAPLRDLEDAAALVREIQGYAQDGNLLQWGIARADAPERVVGTCTLADIDRQHRRAEIGFAVAQAHWGEGIATKAAARVVRFGFDTLDLHRIAADVDPRNIGSIRVLERLGFRHEGRLREHYWQSDEWQDGVLYGLLRGEDRQPH